MSCVNDLFIPICGCFSPEERGLKMTEQNIK